MNFIIHEITHIVFSVIVGFFVWRRYRSFLVSFFAALLGGVFIDLDHFIDYFLAFGPSFRLDHFLKGYQFLKSDQIYILAHSYELTVIFFLIFFAVKKTIIKIFSLSFAVALFLHLLIDTPTNHMKYQSFFLTYRYLKKFELKEFVTAEHYKTHLKYKKRIVLTLP